MLGDIVQPTHLLLILVVALLVLGPKRLPEVGRSLGRGLRDFRSGLHGVQEEARGIFNDALEEPSLPAADDAFSMTPEPVSAPVAEPVIAAPAAESAKASMTKVSPVEPDPAEFAD